MEWHEAITILSSHIVRISTPTSGGTGWMVSRGKNHPLCAIATAAHVVEHAHFWEQPIRLFHPASGRSLLLRPPERAMNLDPNLDTAGVIFDPGDLPFPPDPLKMVEKTMFLKPGVEIGWLGFPAIAKAGLSFFSGRISTYLLDDSTYFVDGVAINGVSGGPAFTRSNPPELVGVVSAYIPNRATGDALPGVAVVRDVTHLSDVAERFRTFDEAKAQESPPAETPPQSQEGEPTPSIPPAGGSPTRR
jgi:hypothetical protein